MTKPDDRSDQAFDRLEDRLDAFEAKRTSANTGFRGAAAIGQGYRIIIEMIVTVALFGGIGWAVDHFAKTAPWGVAAGVVIGAGVAVYKAATSAARMGAEALAKNPASSVPDDDDED